VLRAAGGAAAGWAFSTRSCALQLGTRLRSDRPTRTCSPRFRPGRGGDRAARAELGHLAAATDAGNAIDILLDATPWGPPGGRAPRSSTALDPAGGISVLVITGGWRREAPPRAPGRSPLWYLCLAFRSDRPAEAVALEFI